MKDKPLNITISTEFAMELFDTLTLAIAVFKQINLNSVAATTEKIKEELVTKINTCTH